MEPDVSEAPQQLEASEQPVSEAPEQPEAPEQLVSEVCEQPGSDTPEQPEVPEQPDAASGQRFTNWDPLQAVDSFCVGLSSFVMRMRKEFGMLVFL